MRITAAAIKIKETIVSSCTIHACLWLEAFRRGLLPQRTEHEMTQDDWRTVWLVWGVQEGFLCDTGEFVDREQAAIIALANGQATETYRQQELHFPDVMLD